MDKKEMNMDNIRILYENLNLIMDTEIRKVKEYKEEIKTKYKELDNKLKEIIEKATINVQEYELLECEINDLKKKVISKGEKFTKNVLKKILELNQPDPQIIFIMNILYSILKENTVITTDNQVPTYDSKNINLLFEYLKNNITYQSINLLKSLVSETSNFIFSNELKTNATQIVKNYNLYKSNYSNSLPEIIVILDFIKSLIYYNTKVVLRNKLYERTKKLNNKMQTVQSELEKKIQLIDNIIDNINLLLNEILKDAKSFKNTKNKNDKIILGYNILEKYSLYEKYIVCQENLYNSINDGYYYNVNNTFSKIKYIIKLYKKYRNKEKFVNHISLSLISYTKGIRKINKEKFIQNIQDYKNNSYFKLPSISTLNNTSNNNILLKSIESNSSSIHLHKSFQTNGTRNNSAQYQSEGIDSSRNIFFKKSLDDSNPTFDNFYQMSNRGGIPGKEWSSDEQTKNSNRTAIYSKDFNSAKSSSKNKNNNKNLTIRNSHKKPGIKLKIEKDEFSLCSICCKNIMSEINDIINK